MIPTGRGWVDIPVAAAAALAAYQFLWRKGVQPVLNGLKKLGRTADEIVHAAQTVPAIERRVTAIEWQLRPNGGSSLRDAVDRVEVSQGETHDEVRTLNESTLGQLAAATETRRIEAIHHDDRTAQEQRHVDDSPVQGPPQGPPH